MKKKDDEKQVMTMLQTIDSNKQKNRIKTQDKKDKKEQNDS